MQRLLLFNEELSRELHATKERRGRKLGQNIEFTKVELHVYMCVYIYIYREIERERERYSIYIYIYIYIHEC